MPEILPVIDWLLWWKLCPLQHKFMTCNHSWERWHITGFNGKACARSFFSVEKAVTIGWPCVAWKPKSGTRQQSETFEGLLAQEGGREFEVLESNRNVRSGPSSFTLTRPPPSCLREHPACSLPHPFLHGSGLLCRLDAQHSPFFLSVIHIKVEPILTVFSRPATHLTSTMTLLNPPQSFPLYYHPCFTEEKTDTKVSPLVSNECGVQTQV